VTPVERAELKKALIALSAYYQRPLTDAAITMMVEDFEDESWPEVEAAMREYRRDPKNRTFPLPAQILGVIRKPLDSKHIAIDLAKQICAAIQSHGWNWTQGYASAGRTVFHGGGYTHANFDDAVIAELGEVALEVIRRRGGWKYLHDEFFDSNEGTFVAQLRDHIESILQLSARGELYVRPSLPRPKEAAYLPIFAQISNGFPKLVEDK
jgi:hypothetical protein